MATNTFNNDSVKRIDRSVNYTERVSGVGPTYRRRGRKGSSGGGTAEATNFPAIVVSGGSGIYIVDITDVDGNITEEGVNAVPVIATAYDLPVGSAVVVLKVNTETLG